MIEGKNRIMIFGPKPDGTYVVEFRTSKGETLAISVPQGETGQAFPRANAVWAFRAGCGSGIECPCANPGPSCRRRRVGAVTVAPAKATSGDRLL
jgi:hypothetical protein